MKIDLPLAIMGIIYGMLLITTVFVRTPFTEIFRIDSLVILNPSETTRPLNLVAGICFAGYGIYSLMAG